jgi:ubiquitin-activating enzyme E1
MERYDRQNRVYGVEGTQKLNNSIVTIYGDSSDLVYELAKDLLLSGLNNLNLNISFQNKINDLLLGNIHLTDKTYLKKCLSTLNPHAKINITSSKKISSDISIFINPDNYNYNIYKSIKTKKICFYVTHDTHDTHKDNKQFKFNIINYFGPKHIVTDIDGELYNLLSLNAIQIEDKNYRLSVSEHHNLSVNDLISINIDDQIYQTKVSKIVDPYSFQVIIESNEFKTFVSQFKHGYVQRLKESITLNHNKIDIDISELHKLHPIHNINPVLQYYFGAFICSETIKGITNKYIPVNQTETFIYSEDLVNRPSNDLSDKLNNLNILIVGSGAIGCELLKNLASLNVSSNPKLKSHIAITDPDHIELSNLSRQFLFHHDDIGKSKSYIASKKIKEYNPVINIVAYEDKLSGDNQQFIDKIFPNVDIVFNALDNIEARLYVDSQCVKYGKPLFESGTLGTKGNTQPVIPNITESYGSLQDYNQEHSYPVCTIKHFPTLIQHTIHWAMDIFNGLFNSSAMNIKKFMDGEDIELSDLEMKILNLNEIDDYIKLSYDIWIDKFKKNIEELLEEHPIDSMVDDKLFWSNGKKAPRVIDFDIKNECVMEFMISCTNLLYETYKPRNKKYNFEQNDFYSVEYDKLRYSDGKTKLIINPLELEKDDDTNYHIMFINATSNMRALNYSIPNSTFYETKGIAGKIVPALSTTTSMIASLIVMEMIKYVDNPLRPITDYSSSYINLASNMFVMSEPFPAQQKKLNDFTYTLWDRFESKEDIRLDQFIKYWSDKFQTTISTVLNGEKMLFMDSFEESNCGRIIGELLDDNIIKLISEDDDLELPDIVIIR